MARWFEPLRLWRKCCVSFPHVTTSYVLRTTSLGGATPFERRTDVLVRLTGPQVAEAECDSQNSFIRLWTLTSQMNQPTRGRKIQQPVTPVTGGS